MVSVVMSVFNGEQFLAEAVESILDQSFSDFEFIVINDGSTDRSGAMLDTFQEKDSRLRVYHQENRGLVESLNRGCSIARGKYIARMDADDIAIRDRLRSQIDFMEEHPEIGLLGGVMELIDVNGRVFNTLRPPVDDQPIRSALYQADCPMYHPTIVMRKTVFASSGGYRTFFLDAEDYDLWLRMAKRSQLANLDAVVLKYRVHPGQVSQRKLIQQSLSTLGACEIAMSAETNKCDTLSSGCAITPAELAKLGVSQSRQQQALILRYRNSICSLALANDISAALSLATEMFRSSRWEYVKRSMIANLWLVTASLYWRQGRVFRTLLAISHAIIVWPIVAVRPFKPFLAKLSSRFP
jgi:glycosyltransferase involved in cell wall biosynthesis